jgi:predicted phosphodiesterase
LEAEGTDSVEEADVEVESPTRPGLVTAGFEAATAAARARGPADLSKGTVVRVGGTQEDAGAKDGVAAVTAAAEGEAEEEGASAVPAVRIAVISDTHGYEDALTGEVGGGDFWTDSAATLPEADVLIHCGDFAIDSPKGAISARCRSFDEWLSRQPGEHKFVVRGNHDPRAVPFPKSKATYVTSPGVVEVAGTKFAFVPFTRRPQTELPEGDVLVTHVPPKGVLDKTYSGERAGSHSLRQALERGRHRPQLWLCGHIHEARGACVVRFGGNAQPPTTVVNAANANTGRATHLTAGPMVCELRPRVSAAADRRAADAGAVETEAKEWGEAVGEEVVGGDEDGSEDDRKLLAVDLGLKTGLALYDASGTLLRYEQLRFDDETSLRDAAPALVREWMARGKDGGGGAAEAAADEPAATGGVQKLTLALEGGDNRLREAWSAAAEAAAGASGAPKPTVLRVTPAAWRGRLLLPKERGSMARAKAAARLVARQVVEEHSGASHEGAFGTDAAEAVLIGYHSCLQLGGMVRDPPIKRYSNGQVVLRR